MTIRESKVESDIRKYALARGWWVSKFTSPGKRGVPDRIFIKNSFVVFIEIKRPGEKPSKQQELRMAEMKRYGALVYWVDNLNDAKEILETYGWED